jgi:fluoride ion exporter CrcB/FEX
MSPTGTDVNIVLWISVTGIYGEAARCHLQRALNQVLRDTNPIAFDPGPSFFENIAGLFMMNLETDILQYMEYAVK